MNKPLIEISRLCKTFVMGDTEVHALQNVDLSISQGEYVSIMGPSGSGKSTLMNILGCLDTPTTGRYLFRGTDVSTLDDDALSTMRGREIGFVFQNFNLLPKLTALQNVELPLMYAGVPQAERRQRAMQSLDHVQLSERMHHHPGELSGGQRQRVAIARALVTRPGILLADEPTGALDSHTSVEIMQLFRELNEQGNTVIVITHDPGVADYARRKITIMDGTISSDTLNPHPRV